jgi:protein tyrosine phosphatase
MELKGEFGHTAVTLDVFKEYVRDVLASKGSRVSDGFQEELEEVDRAVDRASPALFFPTTAAIAVKNRYSNIIPATSSRVVLCEVGADPSSSYINANCVSSPLGGPTFLATQAPLSHTAEDFWRMLWEKQSQIVVMLTKLREGDREKCFEYFPDTDVVKFSASGIQVVLTKKDVTSDVLVRSLILKRGKESREVFQLQYVGWPDFGIPTDFASFAHLFEVYRNLRSSLPLSKAVTIHCRY